jgi:hypothetical protein
VTASRALLLGLLLCAPAAVLWPAPAHAQGEGGATALTVQTVPVLEGVPFMVGGRTFRTNARGRALVVGSAPRLADRIRIPDTEIAPGVRARFNRRKEGNYLFDLLYRVRMSFSDPAGRPVNSGRVNSVTFKGSHGVRLTMKPGRGHWVQGIRVVTSSQGYRQKKLTWVVERATVEGSNVVNRNQQRFVPTRTRNMRVALLLYPAHFSARDALFGFPLGSHVSIEYPNGRVERHALGDDAEVTLPSLPRGHYAVSVVGPGITFERPVALSREQAVELEILSYLDVGLGLGVLASLALGLLLLGRPHLVGAPRGPSARLLRALGPPWRTARRPRWDRLSESPTWRGSIPGAAIAALVFGVLVVLLFGRDALVAAALAVFMFLLYLPLTYVIEKAMYNSHARTHEGARQIARRRRRQHRLKKARTRRDP